MDAIVAASGVSKATIYKHWPDKDSLCLEVLGYVHGLDEEPPSFDSGDLRADLIARLTYEPGASRSDLQDLKEKLWPHLLAYSAKNHSFGRSWRARVLEPSRRGLVDLLERGQQHGLLRREVDIDAALALLMGPLMYAHVFLKKQGKPAPPSLAELVVDGFLARFAKESKRR